MNLIEVPLIKDSIDLTAVIQKIGEEGCHDLWIEVGGHLFEAFYRANLIDHAFIYMAAKWMDDSLQSAFAKPIDFTKARHCHWHPAGLDAVLEVEF